MQVGILEDPNLQKKTQTDCDLWACGDANRDCRFEEIEHFMAGFVASFQTKGEDRNPSTDPTMWPFNTKIHFRNS